MKPWSPASALAAVPTDAVVGRPRVPAVLPVLAAMALLLALTMLNPVGYVGGGGDDYPYLQAARCAVQHGFCLPHDHWARRWPIVLPTAAALRLFGEGQASATAAALLYALAGVGVFVAVVQRHFGRGAALIAGLVFAATPVVTQRSLEIGIDMPEFVFAALAMLCLDRRPALAGLMLGLAIQCRPTALALLPILAMLLFASGRIRHMPALLIAAALPSAVEAALYGYWAGGALLPWKLSLAHARVPSSELSPLVDTHRSPLLNPAYIGGWHRTMGIHVHWSVDGLLNLLADPAIALTIGAALAVTILGARDRRLWVPVGIALLWFGALTYGFAVDPKPRMFLIVAAAAATVFGVGAARHWRSARLVVAVTFALILAKGAAASWERTGIDAPATRAPRWIAGETRGLAVDPDTASFLTLVPQVRALPVSATGDGYRRMLMTGADDCPAVAQARGFAGWRPVRAARFRIVDPSPVAVLRQHRLFFARRVEPVLCLFARPAERREGR